MSDPITIIEGFVAAWNQQDFEAIIGFMHDDIFYHNIPMTPLSGKANVRAYLEAIGQFDKIDWKILNIAANGEKVLTERVDAFTLNDRDISLPIMGIFELKDGLIWAWRDYFDLEDYRRQRFG